MQVCCSALNVQNYINCAGLLYYPLYRWCIRSTTPYSVSNRIVYRNRDMKKIFYAYRLFNLSVSQINEARVSRHFL
jgi:hypothetical protein